MELSQEMVLLIVLLFAAGLGAGALAGLLGVGGGIVIVPALYHIFSYLEIDPEIRMHLAVGTSLATIIPTAIRSVRSHYKRGAVDLDLLKWWAPPMIVGVIAGGFVAGIADNEALTMVFAVVALGVAVHMSLVKETRHLRDRLPSGAPGLVLPFGIGGISTLMGIGGGTLGVPILTLFGMPIHRAVATAAGFGLIISIPGAVSFLVTGWNAPNLPPFSLGYVSLIGFAIIVPATLLAVPLGVRLAHWLKPRPLRFAFAFFLTLTSLRMFWDIFG